ncbi:MAG: glycosyltransferase [Nitrososphaerota archaeon]|nr:glycosyltransferase [Nitrososphaerota archaeon]MDG7023951.1 glycosyltransferase [Nitrososphaerota archaeon]
MSIIVPAHNEASSIERTVQALLELDYLDKEIVVVDDGSTDQTSFKVMPYAEQNLVKLVRRETASGSKAGAIDYGVSFCTGDILYVVDADTLVERKAISEATKFFQFEGTIAVSGNVRILAGDGNVNNLLTKLQSYEYLISIELGRRYNALMGMLIIISGAFGGFRIRTARELGLFDKDTLTEDFDLTMKLRKTGGRIFFAPESIAWTYCPATLRSWFRQRRRWAVGQIETLVKHKDVFLNRRFRLGFRVALYDTLLMDVVLLFARTAWVLFVLLDFSSNLFYTLVLIYLLYVVSELVTFVSAGLLSPRKTDVKLLYLLPIVVFVYRPLYGLVRMYSYFVRAVGRRGLW